jgi:hypothetical protein
MAFQLVEPALAALFTRLQAGPLATPLVKTFSRAHKLPSEVQAEQQPALFLVTMEIEMWNPSSSRTPVQSGHPTTLFVHANIYIYATQEPGDTNPEAQLHDLITKVEETLRFSIPLGDAYTNQDTRNGNLGGIAKRINVEGPVAPIQATGTIQQANIIIPIEMMLLDE